MRRRVRGRRIRKMWDIFFPGWKRYNWNYIERNWKGR